MAALKRVADITEFTQCGRFSLHCISGFTILRTLAITWPHDEFGIDKLIDGGGSGEWLC